MRTVFIQFSSNFQFELDIIVSILHVTMMQTTMIHEFVISTNYLINYYPKLSVNVIIYQILFNDAIKQ